MHAIAVVFDFVEPLVAFGRRVDQLRQLRRDPLWQRRRFAPLPARYGARHDGGIKGLPGRRIGTLLCNAGTRLSCAPFHKSSISLRWRICVAQEFKPGEIVPQSGIYSITHDPAHADMPHEVTVIKGRRAPPPLMIY